MKLPNSFHPWLESRSKPVPENSNRNYKQYSCLFIGVQWQTQKLDQSTKLFLWSKLRGLWSKMKIRSLFTKKEKERVGWGGGEREREKHLTQSIVIHLKISLCSFNVLLSVLTGQSTGNAGIRYILIRAHKTLSRMLCCPGECTEQGTFTNSRSVSPLHHCEKNKFMRLNYMDVIYWNC